MGDLQHLMIISLEEMTDSAKVLFDTLKVAYCNEIARKNT